MTKKAILVLLLALASYTCAVTVYTLDEQFSQTNQTVLRFRVENTSNDTLNGIEIRYHITQDTALIAQPDLYYLPNGSANWLFEDSINATLVIYFPNVTLYPGDTLGGLSGYAIGLHNKNWTTWSKKDDFSQPISNSFSVAENIDILSNGHSVTPNIGKHPGCPIVQFVEIEKDSLSLQILQLTNSDLKPVIIKNMNGDSVFVSLDKTKTDSAGQKLWRGYIVTQDSVEHRGELIAECNGNLLAYFAYGWKPTGASSATERHLWESTDSFVKADFDMGFNQGLAEGQRLALQRDSLGLFADARYVENWKFYRTWEEPGESPVPLIWTPAVMQYEESDIDSLILEWSPIDSINWYRLLVIRDTLVGDSAVFTDTTISIFTMQTSVKIPIPPSGNYVWFVEPFTEVSMSENEDGEEYYYIRGDEAISETNNSNNRPMLRGWLKKLKNCAKKTIKKVVKTATSAIQKTNEKITRSVATGVIKVISYTETLRTKTNSVKKDMKWLQKSYLQSYRYEEPDINASENSTKLYDNCFGKDSFCAMKDSRLLAENWNVGFDSTNWNKVFPRNSKNGTTNVSVHNRCWLTMAQMINHYKGGDIASDEILYNVREGFSDTSGSNPIESMQATKYALNENLWDQATYTALINAYRSRGVLPTIDGWTTIFPTIHTVVNTSVDGWFVGTPRLNTIISTIESGNIMGVSQLNGGAGGGHAMVLNGYKIKRDGSVYVHLLNRYNMGEEEWRYYCNISFLGIDVIARFITNGIGQFIDFLRDVDDNDNHLSGEMFFAYYVPPLYAKGRSSNPSIFNDSDKDSIVDFDEIHRFGTDPSNSDSDGDGISDYKEIWEYKKCETYSGKFMPYVYAITDANGKKNYYSKNKSQISYIVQSDFDGDGLHAALDKDSDGDGYCDKQEEGFLGNGHAHNCERFDATKHPEGAVPNCKSFSVALLAKEKLQMNDRAKCTTQSGSYCPVASFTTSFNGDYGVNLGVNSYVGNVFSAKSVLLRDRSFVSGNLETGGYVVKQSSNAYISGKVLEQSSATGTYFSYYSGLMNNYKTNTNFTLHSQKNINSNESYYSILFGMNSKHTDYNFNSNSELMLNKTGDFELGSLKFQYGAKLHAPTESVILHIGNDFQWNGTIVADDMISAAQHIKIIYYGTNRVYVQTNFAGTIIAPNAEVIVGQSGKNFYGAIYAKSITIHQNTNITWVGFDSIPTNATITNKDGHTDTYYSINLEVR